MINHITNIVIYDENGNPLMAKKTRLQQLGRSDLKTLAEKALTNQERNRLAAAKVRKAKKEAGLQQIVLWLPQGSPAIEKVKKYADTLCEQHLAARKAQPLSPKKTNDLQGRNQAQKTLVNPTENSAGEQGG